jgi:hypothetical protein
MNDFLTKRDSDPCEGLPASNKEYFCISFKTAHVRCVVKSFLKSLKLTT